MPTFLLKSFLSKNLDESSESCILRSLGYKHSGLRQYEKHAIGKHIIASIEHIMDRLTSIKVFVMVADLGSLAGASKALEISRSMATRHIAALEKSLHARLLHRTTRNLSLTSAGQSLLPYCRDILNQEQDLYLAAKEQSSVIEGKLSIATSISFGQLYLASAIERFMDIYPSIQLELRLYSQLPDLIQEKIDIAIELSDHLPENLIGKRLGHCASVICATPHYLSAHGTPKQIDALQNHNCLVHKKLGQNWTLIDKNTKKIQRIEVRSNYLANDSTILLNAVISGRGIACLPLAFVSSFLDNAVLEAILPEYEVNPIGIWALYASRHYQPQIQRLFLDFIQADLAKNQTSVIP